MQADRVDKSAVGFDYQGKTEKHESQKGERLLSYLPRAFMSKKALEGMFFPI